jgi:hypothetical protein
MALRLIYQMTTKLLSWLVQRATSDTAKEIEILVLRHQLAVLQRGLCCISRGVVVQAALLRWPKAGSGRLG